MTLRPNAILETVLYTDDLEATSEFYTSIMNLTLLREDSRMRVLRVSDQNFLLLFRTGATVNPIEVDGGTIPAHDGKGGAHVAFMIHPSEMTRWSERLQMRNVPIESTVTWNSGETSLYFRDPAGNLVELATPNLWRDRQPAHRPERKSKHVAD